MLIGVVFILLGILAIAEPGIAGLAVTSLVGWLLVLGGVVHISAIFGGGGAARVIWQLILGAIYILGGIYFLTHPLLALGSLTLLLSGIILMEAVLELIVYFRTTKDGHFRWMLVNGLITLVLGGLIWLQWPSSSVWAIGTLVGVNLITTGVSRLMLGKAMVRPVLAR
jgi:uncharacterized membrane protein HdeD (DUF308 family)